MNTKETRVFELLDEFARSQHKCFLAEFFPDEMKRAYVLCFRPAGPKREVLDRYACRYVRIAAQEVPNISAMNALPPELIERLNRELGSLALHK